MSASGIRNVFVLKQSENSNHTSTLEICLPSTDLLLGRIVSENQKSVFQQQAINKPVWTTSESISESIFIELLATIRSNGWTVFTSNAYFDMKTNHVIKSFYFEEDLPFSNSSSRRSVSGATTTATTNRNNNGNIRKSNEDSSKGHTAAIPGKSSSSVNPHSNDTKAIYSSSNGNGSSNSATGRSSSSSSSGPTYMKKLKEEEQEVARQSMMDRARMDPQELQMSDAEARQHENNRSAHYAKLGQNFVVGGGDKRGGAGALLKSSTRKS